MPKKYEAAQVRALSEIDDEIARAHAELEQLAATRRTALDERSVDQLVRADGEKEIVSFRLQRLAGERLHARKRDAEAESLALDAEYAAQLETARKIQREHDRVWEKFCAIRQQALDLNGQAATNRSKVLSVAFALRAINAEISGVPLDDRAEAVTIA